jgi:hypothetical protein
VIRDNLIVLPLDGNQLIAVEPVYIEAEQTKIPSLARIVLAQLLPDDGRIEWARRQKSSWLERPLDRAFHLLGETARSMDATGTAVANFDPGPRFRRQPRLGKLPTKQLL